MRDWILVSGGEVREDLPQHLAFCDTSGQELLRAETDIDLSHWYPNVTPQEFRADTSTGSVLRYDAAVAAPGYDGPAYVGVGGHLDTDAVLSLYAFVKPELALEHAKDFEAAAESGDFSFYVDGQACVLYEAVRTCWGEKAMRGTDVRGCFEACFELIDGLLEGDEASPRAKGAPDVLGRSLALVESGAVRREQLSERLAAYRVSEGEAKIHEMSVARPSRFDEPVGTRPWASHRVRNFWDRERLQLLSVPSGDCWVHTLWHPQFVTWDIETLSRPAEMQWSGQLLEWRWDDPRLDEALGRLNAAEQAEGVEWRKASSLVLWSKEFPLLAWSGADHKPMPSSLGPDLVAAQLAPLW